MQTVKTCTEVKKATGKDGNPVSIYKVEMSDGKIAESYATLIPVGTPEAELVFTESNYGPKVKWNKPKNGFGGGFGGGKKATNESFALSYSKDVVCAMIPKMENIPTSSELGKVITQLADTFYTWMEGKKPA